MLQIIVQINFFIDYEALEDDNAILKKIFIELKKEYVLKIDPDSRFLQVCSRLNINDGWLLRLVMVVRLRCR
ncbi:MAG: hypothetical protein KI793_33890 [Rivularia sp. (in: Bacteria)]|nr:hypothetical protein [Rivularia sp. MS3]